MATGKKIPSSFIKWILACSQSDEEKLGSRPNLMSRYVLDHHLEGEKKRLALMSQLLDPMHRRLIESLGISREARVLEVGCGDSSMSAWMAGHVAPHGQIVAT